MTEERFCPNCGDGFASRGRGVVKRFCSPGCKKQFHNRANGEGAAAIQLVKAWIETRHAKAGTPEADICRKARSELTQLARLLIEADRAAGRPPANKYVADLLKVDRTIDRR